MCWSKQGLCRIEAVLFLITKVSGSQWNVTSPRLQAWGLGSHYPPPYQRSHFHFTFMEILHNYLWKSSGTSQSQWNCAGMNLKWDDKELSGLQSNPGACEVFHMRAQLGRSRNWRHLKQLNQTYRSHTYPAVWMHFTKPQKKRAQSHTCSMENVQCQGPLAAAINSCQEGGDGQTSPFSNDQ